MKKSTCVKCYREHYNIKKNKCNICLKRVPCKVAGCNKWCDKEFKYCFKCNQDFRKYETLTSFGKCVIESDDD